MAAGVVDYAVRDRVVDAGLRVASTDLLVRLRFTDVGVAIGGRDSAAVPLFAGSDAQLARLLSSTR